MSMLEKDIDQAEVELSLEDVEEDDDTLEAEAEEALPFVEKVLAGV